MDRVGTSLDQCGYPPINKLGGGAYGIIYRVEREGNQYAAKYYRPKPDDDKIDLMEIDIECRLHHPNLIHALDILTPLDCSINSIAIVLPLANSTLKLGWIPTMFKLRPMYEAALGLKFLHSNNILHLDIKPDNIAIFKDGNVRHAKLIDFGVSAYMENNRYVSKYLVGTERYIDPHIIVINRNYPQKSKAVYTRPADIWALGITFLETLTENSMAELDDPNISQNFIEGAYYVKYMSGIATEYRDQAINLIRGMLAWRPQDRLDIAAVCAHPLFEKIRQEDLVPKNNAAPVTPILHPLVDNIITRDPTMLLGTENITAEYVNNIARTMIRVMPKASVETLFLAMEIVYRCNIGPELGNFDLAAIWTAYSLLYPFSGVFTLQSFIVAESNNTDYTYVQTMKEEVIQYMYRIISELKGVININQVFHFCQTRAAVIWSYTNIMLKPEVYRKFNPNMIPQNLQNNRVAPVAKRHKTISLKPITP